MIHKNLNKEVIMTDMFYLCLVLPASIGVSLSGIIATGWYFSAKYNPSQLHIRMQELENQEIIARTACFMKSIIMNKCSRLLRINMRGYCLNNLRGDY